MTAADLHEVPAARPEFVDVYDDHVGPLWRYVRSRVPDPYAAEDLTAEVFSRAWKGWGRFDPQRGNAAAWLFGIAHNVVADWWRHRPAEVAMEDPATPDPDVAATSLDPAGEPLRREATERVAAAVTELSERDRDALALRYGGGLAVADVAAVLGVSLSAAKMTLSRALERLRSVVAADDVDVVAQDLAPTLSSLLDDTRGRLVAGQGDPATLELVAHLALVHTHDVPDELPRRIAACIGCREYRHELGDGDRYEAGRGERPVLLAAAWVLVGALCLVCVLPVLWPVLGTLGLSGAAFVGHNTSLLASPVVFWLVRRQSRRHGDALPVRLAGTGVLLLLSHAAMHGALDVAPHDGTGLQVLHGFWVAADWAGTGLVLAGVLAHWRSLDRWLRQQRAGLVERITQPQRRVARQHLSVTPGRSS